MEKIDSKVEKPSLEVSGFFIEGVVKRLSLYAGYLSGIVSVIMSIGIIVDLAATHLFKKPLVGMIEYETFMLVTMGFLSLSYTLLQKGHVSVDILSARLSPNHKRLLEFLFSFLGFVIFLVMTLCLIGRAIESYKVGEATTVTYLPLYPILLVSALGCLLVSLGMITSLIHSISEILTAFKKPLAWISLGLLIGSALIVIPCLLKIIDIDMSGVGVSVLFIGLMLLMLIIGFPVAFSMILIGFIGIWYLRDLDLALTLLKMNAYDSVAHYYYCVVPFFILMGFFCLEAGIGKKLYSFGNKFFGRMPGGLAIGTIIGCAGFAAISGDSMATAATMGSVSLPEMKRYGYDPSLATGSVAAGGTLGILIPPSIGFIAYAIVTEQSIGKLFMAGIIPGILLTIGFVLVVLIRCLLNPSLGPKAPKSSCHEKLRSLRDVWQVAILFGIVIGGIYSGYITPTEAGGVGVIGALLIALLSKNFDWNRFLTAILKATQMTGMIFAILIGVSLLGYFVTLTDLPMQLASFLSGLPVSRYLLFVFILFFYVVLGMLMNIIPMIMLTLPILFPTIKMLGFDPIWFGVIMVIIMEMGQITPPIGINVFVIHGVAGDVPMMEIFRGIIPFIIIEILIIFLLVVFPWLATLLPNSMHVLAPIAL